MDDNDNTINRGVELELDGVKKWFPENDLLFAHLATRITLEGQSSYGHFAYVPSDNASVYFNLAAQHFGTHNSLVNKDAFRLFSAIRIVEGCRNGDLGQGNGSSVGTGASSKVYAWHMHKFDINKHSQRDAPHMERRRQYYSILEKIDPDLANREIVSTAYSRTLKYAESGESSERRAADIGFGFAYYFVMDGHSDELEQFVSNTSFKIVTGFYEHIISSLAGQRHCS